MKLRPTNLTTRPSVAFNTIVGEVLMIDGQECHIHGPTKTGSVTFVVNDTNEFIQVSEMEFRRKLRCGEIVLHTETTPLQLNFDYLRSFVPRKGRDRSDLEDGNYRSFICRRILDAQLRTPRLAHHRWLSIIEEAHYQFLRDYNHPSWLANKSVPVPSTVRLWIREANGDRDPIRYIPHFARCGRRGSRLAPDIEQLISTAIDKIWKEIPEISIQLLAEKVQRTVRDAKKKVPRFADYTVPSIQTIRRRINSLGGEEILRRKEGKRASDIAYRGVNAGPNVRFPNERWEMDHTELDIWLRDPTTNLVLGRPWVTAVVDYATRAVCAFVVSLNTPSGTTILEAVRLAILPKTEEYLRFFEARFDWPTYGLPVEIAVDRGRDFLSVFVLRALASMGINVVPLPPKSPYMKGAVESFFRTLNLRLNHILPGTTKSNPKKRGDRKPQNYSVVSPIELEKLIGKWICDEYHVVFQRGLEDRPLDAWNAGIKIRKIKFDKSTEWIRLHTMLQTNATAARTGLQIKNIRYNGDIIRRIRSLHHAATRQDPRIEVFLDPEDVSYVLVKNPENGEFIEVPAIHRKVKQGVSWRLHEYIRKKVNLNRNDVRYLDAYDAERTQIDEKVADLHRRAAKSARQLAREKRMARRGRITNSPAAPDYSIAQDNVSDAHSELEQVAPAKPDTLPTIEISTITATRKRD